jgi:hypothetical protein
MATKPQTKPEPKSQLSRIRDTYPRYADLIVKQAELLARQEVVHAAAVPLAERGKRAMASWQAQLPKPKVKPVVRHSGAVALLDNLLPEQTHEELNPPPPRPSWDGEVELSELSAEAESIQEALKLLAPELPKARREYSKLVAAQRGEEYTAIVETIVDAANAFSETLLQHHVFINDRREDGVAWRYFRPIDVTTHFGDLAEDFSPLRRLVLAAIEQRHVGAGKLKSVKIPVNVAYLQEGS